MQEKNPQNIGCTKENLLKTWVITNPGCFLLFLESQIISVPNKDFGVACGRGKSKKKVKPQAVPKGCGWFPQPSFGQGKSTPGTDFQQDVVCSHSFIFNTMANSFHISCLFHEKEILFGISKRTIFTSSALSGFITPIQQCSLEPDLSNPPGFVFYWSIQEGGNPNAWASSFPALKPPPGYPHQKFYCFLITHLLASDCYIFINKFLNVSHKTSTSFEGIFLLIIKILQGLIFCMNSGLAVFSP